MARMSIDDKLTRDPRAIMLGRIYGWRRQEAIGRLIDVFALTYDRVSDVLPLQEIDIAAEQEGFAESMVLVGLAERATTGLRIKGAAERIGYLLDSKESGRIGGVRSGESRRKQSKGKTKRPFEGPLKGQRSDPSPNHEGSTNPPSPSPVPDPDSKSRAGEPRPHRLDPTWKPSDSEVNRAAQAIAKSRGVDLEQQLAALHDWARDSGKTGKDWDARWRNWLRSSRPQFANGTQNGINKAPLRMISTSDEPDLTFHNSLFGSKP